jgi:hypothetical protein
MSSVEIQLSLRGAQFLVSLLVVSLWRRVSKVLVISSCRRRSLGSTSLYSLARTLLPRLPSA